MLILEKPKHEKKEIKNQERAQKKKQINIYIDSQNDFRTRKTVDV